MDVAAMTGQSNGNCGGTAYSWHPADDRKSDARVPNTGVRNTGLANYEDWLEALKGVFV